MVSVGHRKRGKQEIENEGAGSLRAGSAATNEQIISATKAYFQQFSSRFSTNRGLSIEISQQKPRPHTEFKLLWINTITGLAIQEILSRVVDYLDRRAPGQDSVQIPESWRGRSGPPYAMRT
jgi:hypothetical protein